MDEVRRLDASEARRGRPVRLIGIVTYYYSPSTGFMVIQDPTGGISVDITGTKRGFARGERVEVEGFTGPGDRVPVVLDPRVTALGPAELPAARPVSLADLESGGWDYQWVEVRGIVRSAHVEHDGTLRLEMSSGSSRFAARLAAYEGLEFPAVVGASVRVRGVANAVVGVTHELIRVEVLVPDETLLFVEEPPQFSVPVRPIAAVPWPASDETRITRVRISGAVVEQQDGRSIVVQDGTGSVRVRSAYAIGFGAGERVDVVGFPALDRGQRVLEDAALARADRSEATGRLPLLTSASAIRELDSAEASRGYPVRLRAVVTYYDPDWSILWVQDATAGIFVDGNGLKPFDVKAGQIVEVEGRSDPGGFAPQISEPRIRVLGRGAMPPDLKLPLKELFTGRYDSQWVEAEGVVQSVTAREDHVWLDISEGLYHFRAHSTDIGGRARLDSLTGARVRVRGVCVTDFNRKRQLHSIDVYVPDPSHVAVLRPGASDPFSLPVTAVAGLLQFKPRGEVGERAKVRGAVTLWQPGGVFVNDASGGVFVETETADPLRPGDEIEAVGFPAGGEYAPRLRDAIVRKMSSGTAPAPVLLSAAEAAMGNHDAELVSLDAYLLEHFVTSGEHVLTLQAGKLVFAAHLGARAAGVRLDGLRRGSLVRVTGVCSVRVESFAGPAVPTSFRILLRSPEDVVVLVSGPWWSLRHTLWAGGILVAILLACLAWAAMLRHRVRAQTEVIRLELERKALLDRRYRELIDNANDAVYVQDIEGCITSINSAGERIFGRSRAEILQKRLSEFAVPEHRDLACAKADEVLAGGSSSFEIDVLAGDGTRVTLEVSARAVELEGAALGIEGIARDVTARKVLEAQFRQSQKMEAVGRLAGGMAHDFNNLLGVVMGQAELLERGLPAASPARERVREILRVVDRATGLIRQLLAFSRKQVLKRESLDIRSVVVETTSMLRRVLGEDVLLETVLSPGLWKVEADSGQIQQVLLNLAINARDAMPHGGRLTIEAANATLGEEYVKRHLAVQPGRYVRLAVTDTGTGMDAATRARIFEPFFTTKPVGRGTGLGLATVYGIVKQSGGDIWVYSEPGQGSTFKVYLPLAPEVENSVAEPARSAEDILAGCEVVLVVEDDESLRAIVREVLQEAGYHVLEARHPEQALRVCEEHTGPIDLVLTDLVMPGMNGPDLVHRLARVRPQARVLYMSGYSDAAVERHGMLGEETAFIEKPFTMCALTRKLREVLDARAVAPRTRAHAGPASVH